MAPDSHRRIVARSVTLSSTRNLRRIAFPGRPYGTVDSGRRFAWSMTSLNGCCGSRRAVLTWLRTSDQDGLGPDSYAPRCHALGNANRDCWPHERVGEDAKMSFCTVIPTCPRTRRTLPRCPFPIIRVCSLQPIREGDPHRMRTSIPQKGPLSDVLGSRWIKRSCVLSWTGKCALRTAKFSSWLFDVRVVQGGFSIALLRQELVERHGSDLF